MTPVLRAATPNDIPALVAIEQESFSHPHWDEASFLQYQSKVAEIEGDVVGFLVSRETFPGGKRGLAEREILNLAVSRPFRRMGIATALLQDELRRPAIHFLEVRQSNVAAQELYRKIGFVQVGSRPRYYEFPTESAIVMQMKKC